MFHPWRALHALTHVVVVWVRPHPAAPAATNGIDVVWLDPRLTHVERRCVLAHELVHLEHSHRGCQPAAVEHAVRAEAARRLITLEDLLAAIPWSEHLAVLADELWVTEQVLLDRLAGLTPTELQAIAARAEVHHA